MRLAGFKSNETQKKGQLERMYLIAQKPQDKDSALYFSFDKFDDDSFNDIIQQFQNFLKKPDFNESDSFKNIFLLPKNVFECLIKNLTNEEYQAIHELLTVNRDMCENVLRFVIYSLENFPYSIQRLDFFLPLIYSKIPLKSAVEAIEKYAIINPELLKTQLNQDFDFLFEKIDHFSTMYPQLSTLISCLDIFFRSDIIDNEDAKKFLSYLAHRVQNLRIDGSVHECILNLFSHLTNPFHLSILFENETIGFLMKNFTIFPSSSSKNSILILIGNTVQEPFIGELSKLNVLYFLFVVVGVISDVYINKKKSNESLLFLSSAISIAVSLVRFSPEIRESISTSDFTQRLRNDYNTYSFSHKVEALRYVFSYIDFISESPAINLVMSFDIIAIISEMIYSDESEVLRMLLHTFSIALEDEINNATNPVLNALIEFSKTDDFYSAFQILLDHQEADIAEKAQLLIDHLAENDM